MNETVCFTSLGKIKTASFPASKIIRVNTHALLTLEAGFLKQFRGGE